MRLIILICLSLLTSAFQQAPKLAKSSALFQKREEEQAGGFNPLKEISDMFASFDDVIEDFFYKRMGNGEVFYGKRKYKPSGRPNTEGDYNGMGLSDKTRIDISRLAKAEFEEKRKQLMEKQRDS